MNAQSKRWILRDQEGEFVAEYESDDDEQLSPGEVIVTSDGRGWRIVQALRVETTAEFADRAKVGALVVEPE
jgi:hypothetical protein